MNGVVIIGSGNVAEAFARALPEHGIEVRQVFARNRVRGNAVAEIAGCGHTDDPSRIADADIYIVAVSDSAVETALAPLTLPASAVVAHTAGSRPLDAIPCRFARRAVLYPLQTFTAGRDVDFSHIPFFVEGSSAVVAEQIKSFARVLSDTVFEADSDRRAIVHMAGVFANNFVNHMYALGGGIVESAGLPFSTLAPLILETAYKAVDSGDPLSVQTGPAVRNDFKTRMRHLEMLADKAQLKSIYSMISQNIWEKTSRKK